MPVESARTVTFPHECRSLPYTKIRKGSDRQHSVASQSYYDLSELDRDDIAVSRFTSGWSVSTVIQNLAYARVTDWDCEGASAVEEATFEAAKDLLNDLRDLGLSAPDIIPSADGALCMEWIWTTRSAHKIFIDIGPGTNLLVFYRRNYETGERHFESYDAEAKLRIFSVFDHVTENLDA